MKVYLIRMKRIKAVAFMLFVIFALAMLLPLISYAKEKIEDRYDMASSEESGDTVIIIDAGHGGEDPGAIGVTGQYEKDLNLSVALLLGEELAAKGYTVVYTRTTDKMLYSEEENIKGMRKLSDLKNRCKVAEEYPSSVFISIHMNSYGASKYSGTQVYYQAGKDTSRRLANLIQSGVKDGLQKDNDRVVKEGKNIYLLENCPSLSVLVECGFLTNEDECKKLSEKEYQKQLSFYIACAIIEYIKQDTNK